MSKSRYNITNGKLTRFTNSKLPLVINSFARILGLYHVDMTVEKNKIICVGVADESHPKSYSECSDLLCLTLLLGAKEVKLSDVFLINGMWISMACSTSKSLFGTLKFYDEKDYFGDVLVKEFIDEKITPCLDKIKEECIKDKTLEPYYKLLLRRLKNLE